MKYPHLFEPKKVGNVILRNRIISSATGHLDLRADHNFTDEFINYYERRAQGGAAVVTIGECHINPPESSRGGLCVDLSTFSSMSPMSKLNDAITRHGAVCSPELQHVGIYAGGTAYGPMDGEMNGKPVHAMDEEKILQTINDFANAAFLAKMAGCQMVTLHGGHGWLMQQFFSPATNQRTDRWGGTPENRARLAVAICDAIHEKCGRNFPIEIRISATEFEKGYGLDDGIAYAMALDGHADLIHCSVGVHGNVTEDNWLKFSPTMFMDDGINVKYAAEIKKHVKNTPIVAIGALSDPEMLEEIIASGQADFVAMARELLCDPDLPVKARDGRPEDIRHCMRCMSCWSNLMSGGIYCALNPETSREAEAARALPLVDKKKVLVAGGGIAGMEAALVAAENGHDVVLCEKSDELGGAIRCEKNVPFKKHMEEYIEYQERQLKKAGVEIRLNTEITPEDVAEQNPDVLFTAIGSRPIVPNMEGIHNKNVFLATDAYRHPEKLGQKVAILGAGLVGCELSIYLQQLGRDVDLIGMDPSINAEGNRTQGMAIRRVFADTGMKVHTSTRVDKILPDRVVCSCKGETVEYEADSFVVAFGLSALSEEALKLGENARCFEMLGDCTGPKTIMSAVKRAWTAARDLGRAK